MQQQIQHNYRILFYQCLTRVWKSAIVFLLVTMAACSSSPELQWNEEEHFRWAEVSPGYFGETGFEQLLASRTNIDFENRVTDEDIADNRHYLNGSGVAIGDIDGDGLADLYLAGLKNDNKLYKNLGGFEFTDITEEAGLAHEGYLSTGVVFADVDGDGDLDLLISALQKENVLYINDGSGTFSRMKDSGLGPAKGSMTMDLADIDADGDLDLYVTNYKEKSVKDIYTTEELEWKNILKEPYNRQNQTGPFTLVPPFDEHYRLFMNSDNRLTGAAESGVEDELYINEGGRFRKVTDTESVFLNENGKPLGLQPDWGLAAKFQDLNNDGLPDLYVCNDFYPQDRIWINQGDGTFRAIHWSAIRSMSFSAMAVDFSDINRDGQLDMFVTEMLSPLHERRLRQMGSDDPTPDRSDMIEARPQYNRNSMYLKREDNTYAEISYFSNSEATEWSWATRFMDINLDGFEDLIVNTGYTYDILDIDTQFGMAREGLNMDENYDVLIERAPSLDLANKFLLNNGGLSFEDRSSEWGFGEEDVSHGLSTADLDNDGDLDFVSNRLNNTAAVFENKTNAPRIMVRLKGETPNVNGVGAKIRLEGGEMSQEKQLSAGGDYLSGSSPVAMFAANEKNNDYAIEVTWPDGLQSRIDGVKANRMYEINKSGAVHAGNSGNDSTTEVRAVFEDVSERIDHKHHEDPFNDSDLQPLLPAKLSQLGPGMTWIDIDSDGDDDLLIASGKGGSPGAFENLGDGTFRAIENAPFHETVPGDQTTIVGWNTKEGVQLLMGSANYEQGNPQVPAALHYSISNLQVEQIGNLSSYSTAGPMAAADYDNDGDVDVFLGGRFVPAHYPRNATSLLYINENGSFDIDRVNSEEMNEIGLVTGAVFTDYDRDGDQDLLLSREWDSIILLENEEGVFSDVSEREGLSRYKGWWNGIATGDFNSDGRPDIAVANRGLNSLYQFHQDKPLRMYYDDFNGDRRVDIIEAYANSDDAYVPAKRLYEYNSLPVIANRMDSYQKFAKSTLRDIFGNRLSQIPYKVINTLQHLLFINSEEGFKAQALPKEAQFSAGFHVGVADYNNDGNEDLFMSQNFFGVPRQVPRLDAGRGLLLEGNGQGSFKSVSDSRSGIKIYGEQRGSAFSDFNSDGKVDLVVSQNSAETKLYLNRTEKSGYRVTLSGPDGNKNGIGSAIRLVYSDGEKGPVREVQSGSGYWSQNSFTQVLGMKEGKEANDIEVQWFDGLLQTVNVSGEPEEVLIEYSH